VRPVPGNPGPCRDRIPLFGPWRGRPFFRYHVRCSAHRARLGGKDAVPHCLSVHARDRGFGAVGAGGPESRRSGAPPKRRGDLCREPRQLYRPSRRRAGAPRPYLVDGKGAPLSPAGPGGRDALLSRLSRPAGGGGPGGYPLLGGGPGARGVAGDLSRGDLQPDGGAAAVPVRAGGDRPPDGRADRARGRDRHGAGTAARCLLAPAGPGRHPRALRRSDPAPGVAGGAGPEGAGRRADTAGRGCRPRAPLYRLLVRAGGRCGR
jgi:hypothetical protein